MAQMGLDASTLVAGAPAAAAGGAMEAAGYDTLAIEAPEMGGAQAVVPLEAVPAVKVLETATAAPAGPRADQKSYTFLVVPCVAPPARANADSALSSPLPTHSADYLPVLPPILPYAYTPYSLYSRPRTR